MRLGQLVLPKRSILDAHLDWCDEAVLRVGMVEAHFEALKSLVRDSRVGAILIEGTPEAFCAGLNNTIE